MKTKFSTLIASIAALSMVACGGDPKQELDTPTTGSISISVDESFRPIIESQVDTFVGIYKYANITASYKPEGEVVKDLMNDSIKIAILSRDLTPQERSQFEKNKIIPRSTKIAVDAVALILNRNNKDTLVTLEELKKVFKGDIKSWKELDKDSKLGDITIVFDNNSSSTARFVKDSLTTDQKLPQNTFAANSHEALIDYVSKNENAIGIIGVNWISDFDDPKAITFQKQITVMGISPYDKPISKEEYYKPFQAYIAQKIYPLRRHLYIISTEGRTGLGTGFASFIAGDQGQRIILKSGLVPATMPVRVIGLRN